MSLKALKDQVVDAVDDGWTPWEDGSEFYTSVAVAAVMRIPLIAAAPDLLVALKAVEEYLSGSNYATDFSDEELNALRAVIAKAEHGT